MDDFLYGEPTSSNAVCSARSARSLLRQWTPSAAWLLKRGLIGTTKLIDPGLFPRCTSRIATSFDKEMTTSAHQV
jgi:hypothetical protein